MVLISCYKPGTILDSSTTSEQKFYLGETGGINNKLYSMLEEKN